MNVKVVIEFSDGTTKEELEQEGVTELFIEKQYKAVFERLVSSVASDGVEVSVTAKAEYEEV